MPKEIDKKINVHYCFISNLDKAKRHHQAYPYYLNDIYYIEALQVR